MNNDLISREYIKAFVCEYEKFNGKETEIVKAIPIQAIDNAPAVNDKAYAIGYAAGSREGYRKGIEDAKPTGERKCKTCKYCDGEIFNKHCGECSHAWPDLYEEAENEKT